MKKHTITNRFFWLLLSIGLTTGASLQAALVLDPNNIPRQGKVLARSQASTLCIANINDKTFQSFHTTWIVPPKPNTDKYFCIWNGVGWGAFLQPVLVWSGGGYYCRIPPHSWGLINVTADSNNKYTLSQNRTVVEPGTEIKGVVSLVSHDNVTGLYTYNSNFEGHAGFDKTLVSPKPPTAFFICLENLPHPLSKSQDAPTPGYFDMKDIYYVNSTGAKVFITNWYFSGEPAFPPPIYPTPQEVYAEILSNGNGGVIIRYHYTMLRSLKTGACKTSAPPALPAILLTLPTPTVMDSPI